MVLNDFIEGREVAYLHGYEEDLPPSAYQARDWFGSPTPPLGVLQLEYGGVRHDVLIAGRNPRESRTIPGAYAQFSDSPKMVMVRNKGGAYQVYDCVTGHTWLTFGQRQQGGQHVGYAHWTPENDWT